MDASPYQQGHLVFYIIYIAFPNIIEPVGYVLKKDLIRPTALL